MCIASATRLKPWRILPIFTAVTNGTDPQNSLDALIIDVATDLMGVSDSEAGAAMDRVLDRLVDFFAVDDAFLRRHRPDRVSELVTIRPQRDILAAVDSITEIAFDDDPVVGLSEHLTEPIAVYPEGTGQVQEIIHNNLGIEKCSLAVVPLMSGDSTLGILGLVRFNHHPWEDGELRTLLAIGTLMAQFWIRLEAERLLTHRAYVDQLTALPNRARLQETLSHTVQGQRQSLLLLNVDNMKMINDGLDYEIGDRFLVGFARRLEGLVRPGTMVARWGGDHFAVFVDDSEHDDIDALALRLVDELRRSVELEGMKISRTVSIGVAHRRVTDAVQGKTDEIVSEAEAALYLAKKDGKNRYRLFDEEMRTNVVRKFEQEIELRRAVENNEFVLHYQPAVNLDTGSIFAVEALLRWNHPSGELMTAGRFIETAEESGLVVEIGDFVLAEGIRQLKRWQPKYPELEMWINVSPAQIVSRNLPQQVADLLEHHNVDPARLCLELTEHAMLEDLATVTGALDQLKSMGVQLALDDFGTGYSSMKQLKSLPFNSLKIDMSFVAGLGRSAHDNAIVDAAITLADSFGLNAVAEGVEDDYQVDELLNRGCTRAQGYLLAMPQSLADVELLLAANRQKA